MFQDLKKAYNIYSDKELKKARRLFSLLKYPWLISVGKVLLRLAFFLHLPITKLIKNNIFQHFCGGETIEECKDGIQKLYAGNVKTILDFSAEGGTTEAKLDAVFAEIKKLIEFSLQNESVPFAVFKPTGIFRLELLAKVASNVNLTSGEQTEFEKGKQRFYNLCEAAATNDLPIFVDAEESWIQKPIDDLTLEMMRKHNKEKALVFNTLQMYRTDRLDYLKELYTISVSENFYIGLKLVRGAYLEKERERAQAKGYNFPVFGSKGETDFSFNSGITFCFDHSDRITVCCASHNELSCANLAELISAASLSPTDQRFWFAQLYGMSNHISFNLADKGYNVCKYVPYGSVKTVMPYLIRRAEENTSVKGQTGRELQLILQEIQRRKSKNN